MTTIIKTTNGSVLVSDGLKMKASFVKEKDRQAKYFYVPHLI